MNPSHTFLVTGGAGFIGSNLTEALLARGHRVVVLDNFSTGKRENIAAWRGHDAFRLIEGDIRDQAVCHAACTGIDYVLHHAALGSVPRSIHDPVTSHAVNTTGFLHVLIAARDAGVKRVVYASSSSVYGDEPTLPKLESKIGTALSPYALTKQITELYAANFHTLYGIETIGLRYFNVFGPRQDPAGGYAAVIPKFAAAMLRGEAPAIHGDGSNSRDFTYIDNVVHANYLAATSADPAAVNTVYNIAGGERTTLNTLFFGLRRELARLQPAVARLEPVYLPERRGDIPHSLADIAKAARLLHYTPRIDFTTGLAQTAEWYVRNLSPC